MLTRRFFYEFFPRVTPARYITCNFAIVYNSSDVLKKIASIFLLAILFYNWCGYRLVIRYMQDLTESRLEAQLDSPNIDETQLIEIRTPLNDPYINDWTTYQRCNGEIEINGVEYKYVKRKIEKGQLILKCIRNESNIRLQTARDEFFRLANDLQLDHTSKKTNSKNIIKFNPGNYFHQYPFCYDPVSPDATAVYSIFSNTYIQPYYKPAPGQPPEPFLS